MDGRKFTGTTTSFYQSGKPSHFIRTTDERDPSLRTGFSNKSLTEQLPKDLVSKIVLMVLKEDCSALSKCVLLANCSKYLQ